MALSVDQFGKSLIASGLLTADEVKASWAALPAGERPKDGGGFAQALVDAKQLTSFQAAELLAGRGARLLMGDYTILAQIGAGGMGQVYKAQHRRMNRIVALKVMSNAAMSDAAAVKRFQREVHAAAKLEHPNIVTAYDSGEAGSVKYLVMQFVDGGDLSDLVKKQGPLGIEQAVGYVLQAARGLAFAHGEGVIHRDIKPANLLLDKKGVVKILDMGLARFEDGGDGLTATEQVMGTVDYMSPEQASDTKHADARADIYSLGCTLWYLLTAKKLYDADSMISRLMKHRDAPLPSLLKERDDAPWPLEQALHKMLAKRPQDRTQTMPDVIAALAPYGGEAPSGSGSSSGLGSGTGHNADMASFMQSMGTSGTNTSAVSASQAKSATKGEVEATEQFSAHDAGTAPKGEALNKGASNSSTRLSKNQAKGSGQRLKLIVAGTLGGMLLLAGIVIKMRDNGGAAVAVVPQTLLPAGPVSTLLPPGEGGRRPDEGRTVSGLTVAQSLDSPDYEWSEPENLGPTINGPTDERAMSLTADQLRIYYDSPSGRSEATRSSSAVPFNKPSKSSGLGESFLSGDGLSMVGITADGSNKYCLKELHRATLDAKWQWDNPRNLCAPAETPEHERHVTMSADGLTLIFTVYNPATGHDVWISRRTSRDGSFGLAEKLGPFVNTQGGTESVGILLGDNQTIVFRRSGVWHFTFTSSAGTKSSLALRSNPFSNDDVWFAPDGRTAYFAADRAGGFGGLDIWVTRLVPKGSAKPKTAPSADQGKVVFLDDLPEKSWSGYGSLGKHGKQLNNAQITWQGSKVEHSLFTATIAPLNLAHVEYEIFGRYDMLRAETFLLRVPVGGPQTFRVLGDGKVLWTSAPQSEPFNVAEAAVNVRNVQLLRLEVSGVPSYSNPLWLNARLIAAP